MVAARDNAETVVRRLWAGIDLDDLNGTYPLPGMVAAIENAQRIGVISSGAYLAAFLSTELGHRVRTTPRDLRNYVGLDRGGAPLTDAMLSPLIGVKVAIGDAEDNPLRVGLDRAVRQVTLDVDHATRTALLDAMREDGRIEGWRRAVQGTCGACLGAAAAGVSPLDEGLRIHPYCRCVTEPKVKQVKDEHPRLTGIELFRAMTPEQQDDALGPEAAEQVRSGKVELSSLVAVSTLVAQEDFITQKPVTTTGATPVGKEGRNG